MVGLMVWWLLVMARVYDVPMQQEDLATIIVYRGSSYGGEPFDLWVADQPILLSMKNNTSVEFYVPAGELALSTKRSVFLQRENKYLIPVEAGHTYYLKAELEYVFPVTKLRLAVSNSKHYLKIAPKLNKIVVDESDTLRNK